MALKDLNGDDHLDAVFANFGGKNTVCLGDGSGEFSCSEVLTIFTADDMSISVALTDLTGDGNLDALFANRDEDGTVCGNSSGTFLCGLAQTGIQASLTVAIEDMNSDGGPDAVFGNEGQPARFCLGNGSLSPSFFSECSEINTGVRNSNWP